MKFSCKTQELLAGLQLASRAIGGEQTLPILQNILIQVEGKRCTLSATNLELSIVTNFEVAIENEGGITVPAKAILNFIQYNQDEEVLLETSEGTQLKLQSKRAKAVISGEPTSGYPTINPVQRETSITLSTLPLLRALTLVTFACARTTSRPVISGVFVRLEKGKLILVGTDSYRLSEYKLPLSSASGEISCIIPAKFLEELKSVIAGVAEPADDRKDKEKGGRKQGDTTVELNLSAQQIEAKISATQLTSRLIDGKFPDYTQVIPRERHTTISVPIVDLLNAVKRMHYFAREVNNSITFTVGKSSVHLMTKPTQLGADESTISVQVEGKEAKIALSSHYLIDFLSRVEGEHITIELLDKVHPAVFRLPSDEHFLHLVMPLRMSEE